MAKFDSFIQLADDLIRENGSEGTLVRTIPGTFNPVTQTEVGETEERTTFQAVQLPPGRSAEHRLGSLINRNITEFYFAQKAQVTAPVPGDIFEFGGSRFTLIWTQTYDPAADGRILTTAYGER